MRQHPPVLRFSPSVGRKNLFINNYKHVKIMKKIYELVGFINKRNLLKLLIAMKSNYSSGFWNCLFTDNKTEC